MRFAVVEFAPTDGGLLWKDDFRALMPVIAFARADRHAVAPRPRPARPSFPFGRGEYNPARRRKRFTAD
jgi:hypothetical protein